MDEYYHLFSSSLCSFDDCYNFFSDGNNVFEENKKRYFFPFELLPFDIVNRMHISKTSLWKLSCTSKTLNTFAKKIHEYQESKRIISFKWIKSENCVASERPYIDCDLKTYRFHRGYLRDNTFHSDWGVWHYYCNGVRYFYLITAPFEPSINLKIEGVRDKFLIGNNICELYPPPGRSNDVQHGFGMITDFGHNFSLDLLVFKKNVVWFHGGILLFSREAVYFARNEENAVQWTLYPSEIENHQGDMFVTAPIPQTQDALKVYLFLFDPTTKLFCAVWRYQPALCCFEKLSTLGMEKGWNVSTLVDIAMYGETTFIFIPKRRNRGKRLTLMHLKTMGDKETAVFVRLKLPHSKDSPMIFSSESVFEVFWRNDKFSLFIH